MTNCEYCNKPLKKIGNNRKNGKHFTANNGNDWNERKYHKKCYKEVKDREKILLMLENLNHAKHQNPISLP